MIYLPAYYPSIKEMAARARNISYQVLRLRICENLNAIQQSLPLFSFPVYSSSLFSNVAVITT
jgi:hypothetical protein